jgi:hypothetical protein
VCGFEGFTPLFRGIDRQPPKRQLGLAGRRVFECYRRQQFKRPRWTHRVPREATGFVREGMHAHEPFRRNNFAIDEFCPHDPAGGVAHGAVIRAADAQIHF